MTRVTRGHRIYFAAVGILALWVGVLGYFIPGHVDVALPWLVPPLHARFLGAMYLSGATFMIGGLFARQWAEVRVVLPMIAIWPWKITPLLAHLYSAPFLSYGLGSLLLGGRQTWLETRIALAAMWVFAVGVLLASMIHHALFSINNLPTWLWFAGFITATFVLAFLSVLAWLSDARLPGFGPAQHQTEPR